MTTLHIMTDFINRIVFILIASYFNAGHRQPDLCSYCEIRPPLHWLLKSPGVQYSLFSYWVEWLFPFIIEKGENEHLILDVLQDAGRSLQQPLCLSITGLIFQYLTTASDAAFGDKKWYQRLNIHNILAISSTVQHIWHAFTFL